jgi:membrane fusion protein (multidrug efflux system)
MDAMQTRAPLPSPPALLLSLLLLAAAAPATKAVRPAPAPAKSPAVVAVFTAEQTVALRAAVDGRVQAVGASEGGRVAKGVVLVQLDDREQRARVALAGRAAGSSAEAAAADVRRREAAARLASTESAAAKGAATDWELRQARAAVSQADADARAARERQGVEGQRLQLERVMLDNYVVRAPFAGRVTRLGARPGMSVRKSDVLAVVVDLKQLRGEAFVPVARYGQLKLGASYPALFGAPFSRRATARLAYVDPVIDGGMVRAVFRIDNSDETLPSGLQANIQLTPLAG